ncbi:MAG TPA: hypothetical protein VGA97_05030 [Acidimicrobiia bacterium]|jgi:hypothetical protein
MIFGYLDPGSGSLILQALLGGIAGIGVAYKAWKHKRMTKRLTKEGVDPSSSVDDPSVTAES